MINRKLLIILIIFVVSANAQLTRNRNTMSAGFAMAVGEGASRMNPGINISYEPTYKINEYLRFGAQFEHSWISARVYDGLAGIHAFDASLVPKLQFRVYCALESFFTLSPILTKSG